MRKEKFPDRVIAHDFAVIGSKVYYSALNCNGLYCYDIHTDNNKFLGFFPEEGLDIRHLHSAVVVIKQKLYFVPMNGNCISIYDTVSQSFKTISIADRIGNISSKYYGICTCGNMIYMIPSRAEYIAVVDSDMDSVAFHNEWLDNIDFHQRENLPAVKNGTFIHDQKLYIPYLRENLLLIVSLTDFSVSEIRIGDMDIGFTDAVFDQKNKRIWLLVNGCYQLIGYSLESGQCTKISLCDGGLKCDYPFIRMLPMNDKIVFVPYQANKFLVFDVLSEKMDYLRKVPGKAEENEWGIYYYSAKKISDYEFIAMGAGDYMAERINIKGETTANYIMTDRHAVIRRMLVEKNFFKEKGQAGLESFIDFLVYTDDQKIEM